MFLYVYQEAQVLSVASSNAPFQTFLFIFNRPITISLTAFFKLLDIGAEITPDTGFVYFHNFVLGTIFLLASFTFLIW